MAERLLTVPEWARLLGVSRATAYRRLAAGEVERINIGTRGATKLRISESAHREYLRRCTIPGPRTTKTRRVA